MFGVPMLTRVTVNANFPSRTSWFNETVGDELRAELWQPVTAVVTAGTATARERKSAGVLPTQHSYHQRPRA
ncbi:MAG: hypothetical protein JWP83_1282 [Mycobacterium sp.]|jgi:hypothetical protein|nr:hypothetical protein [Mycobacterium sp.]